MSDKERQQGKEKTGKTPKKGNKKAKGKDSNKGSTGSDEAGGSGETNVTNVEFMDLQAQQEEQHDEIRSLQTDLTEMKGQLEEARASNAEMKAMLVKVLNAVKTTTNVPEEQETELWTASHCALRADWADLLASVKQQVHLSDGVANGSGNSASIDLRFGLRVSRRHC